MRHAICLGISGVLCSCIAGCSILFGVVASLNTIEIEYLEVRNETSVPVYLEVAFPERIGGLGGSAAHDEAYQGTLPPDATWIWRYSGRYLQKVDPEWRASGLYLRYRPEPKNMTHERPVLRDTLFHREDTMVVTFRESAGRLVPSAESKAGRPIAEQDPHGQALGEAVERIN